jgi:uncharacterized protein YdhG (YjbR/CyaY superfamily)
MKERAQELNAAARASKDKADGESAALAKIAEMPEPDRAIGERLHAIIKASAPALWPKTWYGMPAYAKEGKVPKRGKFKSRYATLGFSDEANLDKGAMWPTSFALKELTAADEARIGTLVKKRSETPPPAPTRSSRRRLARITTPEALIADPSEVEVVPFWTWELHKRAP